MYPKINFPEYSFKEFREPYCPFTFKFPDYWIFVKDTSFFGEKPLNECWFNFEMKDFNGTVHCSYFDIHSKPELDKYLKDAFKLAREHQIKANYIDEIPIIKPNKVSGMLYNIEGPSASPFQFYLTDSINHFFRGSLYFNAQAKPDSIGPISEFVKKDLVILLNSFEWK
jgi:gliding motility-associated lipoprotein GldD